MSLRKTLEFQLSPHTVKRLLSRLQNADVLNHDNENMLSSEPIPDEIQVILNENTRNTENNLQEMLPPGVVRSSNIKTLSIPTEEGLMVFTIGERIVEELPDVRVEEVTDEIIDAKTKRIIDEMKRVGCFNKKHFADIKNNIDFQCPNTGASLLFFACYQNYFNLVKALVHGGANIQLPEKSGATPLFTAAENGYFDMVVYLTEKGADINSKINNAESNKYTHSGYTPMLIAAKNGYIDIAKYLIKKGAILDDQEPVLKNCSKLTDTILQAKRRDIVKTIEPELIKKLGRSFKDYAKTFPKKTHGMWAGLLPHDLLSIQHEINYVIQNKCSLQSTLSRIIAELQKSCNHLPLFEAAKKCQSQLSNILMRIHSKNNYENEIATKYYSPSTVSK